MRSVEIFQMAHMELEGCAIDLSSRNQSKQLKNLPCQSLVVLVSMTGLVGERAQQGRVRRES